MFRYKLHWADGSEAADASYAINIKAGDLIWIPQPNHQFACARPGAGRGGGLTVCRAS